MKILVKCSGCEKEIYKWNYEVQRQKRTNGGLFCSNACQGIHKKNYPDCLSDEAKQKIRDGAARGRSNRVYTKKPIAELKSRRVRDRFFENRDRKCEICGWGEINPFHGMVTVQLHHIDGDNKNNEDHNLQALCPNCHSLTEHFMNYGRTYGDK